jgi:hypothetical protein
MLDPIPELALLSAGVRRCMPAAVAVVTQYVTQLPVAGIFVPKPGHQVCGLSVGASDVQFIVHQCPPRSPRPGPLF